MVKKIIELWAVLLFSLLFLLFLAVGGMFLVNYFRWTSPATAYGRHNLSFRVYYHENNIFEENPIPRSFDFLMSYTNYIVIESNFAANFSKEVAVYYSYSAEKRFVIRQMGAADTHRFVFEEITPLSQSNGQATAERLNLNGGSYTIHPKPLIEQYFYFIADHALQMDASGVVAHGLRGFSAELFVNFTYTFYVPELGLRQSATQGYRIPLTLEVYSLTLHGAHGFEWQEPLPSTEISVGQAALLVAAFSLTVWGLIYNMSKLYEDKNEHRRAADSIYKKYSNEIIVYSKPINKTRYEIYEVQEFNELLKLAINLNKHIMSHQDDTHAEFIIVVDDTANFYEIRFNPDDPTTPENKLPKPSKLIKK